MQNTRLFASIILASSLVLGGCGTEAISTTPPTLDRASQGIVYRFSVMKSPTYVDKFTGELPSTPAPIQDLLDASRVEYQVSRIGQQDMITKLAGVISTGSKGWYLYVNNQPTPIISLESIVVSADDTIEWRYEPIH